MGVIYKLREEVVHFIVSQRRSNPLASCRQLAESASQKFGLHLSKSSVHDVLKESGIVTPRGRKPKDKFEIPQERKKQIQVSLSQIKLIPPMTDDGHIKETPSAVVPPLESENSTQGSLKEEISSEDHEAGKIFLKAVFWDLGIFSEEQDIRTTDWDYYLTYTKGINVVLENNKNFFIDLSLPLERCIRETVDGLINNVRTFIVHKVSDEMLFKAGMDAQAGFKIKNISIMDQKDHVLSFFNIIMDYKRNFLFENRVFVESNKINAMERVKSIFFSQIIDNNEVMDNILNLKGLSVTNKNENIVTLLVDDSYENKTALQEAVDKLNGMYLCDGQNRLVKVKIQPPGSLYKKEG